MKKLLLSLFILSATFVGKGQNLVPNGDFEQYSGCPDSLGQIDSCLNWFSGGGWGPHYFNSCTSNPNISVPYNTTGYQPALSGNAYCGIMLANHIVGNYRDFLEVQLPNPLLINSTYYFEMYVNLIDYCGFTTDAIGAYFSDTMITGLGFGNPPILPVTPQIINAPGNYFDTLSWVLVNGIYTANGGENFLVIGNFINDLSMTMLPLSGNLNTPYPFCFIDNVLLTDITATTEHPNQTSNIQIHPNPAKDLLFINDYLLLKKENEIKIYDTEGRKVLQQIINNQSSIINIQSLQNAMYFIEINGERKKFIKE